MSPRKSISILTYTVLALAGFVTTAHAQEDRTTVTLAVSDGSYIIGRPLKESVQFRSVFGVHKLDLAQFVIISQETLNSQWVAALVNGDRLTGALIDESIAMDTLLGRITVNAAHIRTITAHSDGQLTAQMRKALILHYECSESEGTGVRDASRANNDGTLHGCSYDTDRHGRRGGAIHLDGVKDYIDISAIADDIPRDRHTVSVWIKADRRSGYNVIFGNLDRELLSIKDGFLLLQMPLASSWHVARTSTAIGIANVRFAAELQKKWVHVTFTFEPGATGLYINGKIVGANTGKKLGAGWYERTFCLGRTHGWGTSGGYFAGSFDDVMIFNRALSADEIAHLYVIQR